MIGNICGRAFNRRRRRRELRIDAVAKMLDVRNRAVSHFECGRLHGVSKYALGKLDMLNMIWTLEDYENGTYGTEPTWPVYNTGFGLR